VVQVKICGVTDPSALAAALAGEARMVGFVFFPKSPRNMTPERAGALAHAARGRADTVAVTVDAPEPLLAEIAETLAPDYIQLHGHESPAAVHRARAFARSGVIKALPIGRREDLAAVDAYKDVADIFLFDAKAPAGAALPGGNGAAFDWRILRNRTFPKPFILSGGLNAANVAEAVAESGAQAVDVSSGVERAPGVKDEALIAQFLAAARAAQPR
jgi:phosphoribosylanthranilate isomerase